MPGYEADDIVGTLTKLGDEAGYTSVMVNKTMRSWFHQPTNNDHKGGGYDNVGVKEFVKVGDQRVDQVIDILGLMGDSSDNIPGIPGIGEKTAQSSADYSFEGIYEHIDEMKGSAARAEFKEQGALSHRGNVDRDIPVTVSLTT